MKAPPLSLRDYSLVDHYVGESHFSPVSSYPCRVVAIGKDGTRLWTESRHWSLPRAEAVARRLTRKVRRY